MADIDPKSPTALELERKIGTDPAGVTVNEKLDTAQADLTTVKADAGATRTLAEGANGFAAIKAETALVKSDTTTALANISTLDGKVVAVASNVTSVKGSIENGTYGLAALQTMLANLEANNVTRFETFVLPQLMKPQTGDPALYYISTIMHTDENGAMADFASAPLIALYNQAGTLQSNMLYDDASGSNVITSAVRISAGYYVFYIKVTSTTTALDGYVKITAIEGANTLIKSLPVTIQQYFNETFNSGDRTNLGTCVSNTNSLVTNLALAMTKSGGTFDRATMSLEALAEGLATIAAGTNKKVSAYKRSGAITQGNSETVVLGGTLTTPSIPFNVYDMDWRDLEVIPTTSTSTKFTVEVYSDVALANRVFRVQNNRASNGDLALYGINKVYENSDSPRATKIYVKITNVTDPAGGGSIFDVRVKGIKAVA